MSEDGRRAAVLALLAERRPEWVEGPEITEVGGSEGLRRVRELTQQGYRIDRERIPGRDAWRYRLVASPEEAKPRGIDPKRDGMRSNSMPGRPDRYVDLSKSRGLAADQTRKQRQEEENRRMLSTPYRERPLRIVFGQSLCRACKGTGGNLLDGPCSLCAGKGIEG